MLLTIHGESERWAGDIVTQRSPPYARTSRAGALGGVHCVVTLPVRLKTRGSAVTLPRMRLMGTRLPLLTRGGPQALKGASSTLYTRVAWVRLCWFGWGAAPSGCLGWGCNDRLPAPCWAQLWLSPGLLVARSPFSASQHSIYILRVWRLTGSAGAGATCRKRCWRGGETLSSPHQSLLVGPHLGH